MPVTPRRRSNEGDFYFGFQFVRSFFRIFPHLYTGLDFSLFLTGFLFVLGASFEYVNYNTGIIIGDFYKTLIGHDEDAFWNVFLRASLMYIAQTLILAFQILLSCLLGITFRNSLTNALHNIYFEKKMFYRLNCVNPEGIDNPDQRITQDVENMTKILAKNIMPYIIISPGVIIFYTWKTWTHAGWIGVACIYGYFLFGAVMNRILISPFTKWTARVERAEGNFRYKHVSLRDNAEEIAFYDGADFDKLESSRIFKLLINSIIRLALWNLPGQFFQSFFDYYGGVLTYGIQVIPVFILNSYKDYSPDDLSKQISNNSFFFMYLMNSFTRLTDLAISLGSVAGYCQRIASLFNYAQNINDDDSHSDSSSDFNEEDLDTLFKLQNVSSSPPLDQVNNFMQDITLKIPFTKSLLITGSSGIGKTSLLRVLKQLWDPVQGSVNHCISYDRIMFLPQECYFPVGGLCLKKQLTYPSIDIDLENEAILKVLDSLKLLRILGFCGSLEDSVNFEWHEVLSPGEQQRLSIARVLLQKPKVVILDEATSNLSHDMERTVYELLQIYNICYISVGHRDSLREFHSTELKINGANKWEIQNIPRRVDLML